MAVFASLAEVASTVALPRLQGNAQEIFLWFVMLFPMTIVIPFFVFLWCRPKHLYAPADFRRDPTWLTEQPPRPVEPERKKPKTKPLAHQKQPEAHKQ